MLPNQQRLAHTLLVTITVAAEQPTNDGRIALTVAEVRRLLTAPANDLGRILRWSLWRRLAQAHAHRSHYIRRQCNEGG